MRDWAVRGLVPGPPNLKLLLFILWWSFNEKETKEMGWTLILLTQIYLVCYIHRNNCCWLHIYIHLCLTMKQSAFSWVVNKSLWCNIYRNTMYKQANTIYFFFFFLKLFSPKHSPFRNTFQPQGMLAWLSVVWWWVCGLFRGNSKVISLTWSEHMHPSACLCCPMPWFHCFLFPTAVV